MTNCVSLFMVSSTLIAIPAGNTLKIISTVPTDKNPCIWIHLSHFTVKARCPCPFLHIFLYLFKSILADNCFMHSLNNILLFLWNVMIFFYLIRYFFRLMLYHSTSVNSISQNHIDCRICPAFSTGFFQCVRIFQSLNLSFIL